MKYFSAKCRRDSYCFEFLLLLVSFGSFLVDIATDIIVIYQYYKNEHYLWMILTCSLVTIPSFMVQTFSYRWFVVDERATKCLLMIHLFQLGLFYRFVELLQIGYKLRKKKSKLDLQQFNQQQSDMCMLRLFESFTESAPQLVLQLYIMATTDEWSLWTGIAAVVSVVSLGWGISAYSKAMRNVRPEKQKLTWWGLCFQALWRVGMLSSRIISLVLFAVSYGIWLIIVLCLHWFFMTVWIYFQKTDFCSTWWEERLYNCVIGVIYCFCFFNIKEGKSRYRMVFYYSLTITQNTIFLIAFYITTTSDHYLKHFIVFLVPCGMLVGLTSMLLYYRFFHPRGPITLFSVQTMTSEVQNKKNVHSSNNSTLKTSRKLIKEDVIIAIPHESAEQLTLGTSQCTKYSNSKNLIASRNSLYCVSHVLESAILQRSNSFNYKCNSFSVCQGLLQRKSLPSFSQIRYYCAFSFQDSTMVLPSYKCSCLYLEQQSRDLTAFSTVKFKRQFHSLPNLKLKE